MSSHLFVEELARQDEDFFESLTKQELIRYLKDMIQHSARANSSNAAATGKKRSIGEALGGATSTLTLLERRIDCETS